MNKLVKTISSDKLSYEFLHSLNGIIGLTERELQLFSLLLDLHINKSKTSKHSIDCANNRKYLMETTGVTKDNLSRYMKSYRRKGLLVADKDSGELVINSAVVPIIIGNKTVQITMILKIRDDEVQ